MAEFTPSKKTASDFNNGVEYISTSGDVYGDAVQAETINNLVESALYTQTEADAATQKVNELAEQIGEKQGTSVTVDGVAQATFEAGGLIDEVDSITFFGGGA